MIKKLIILMALTIVFISGCEIQEEDTELKLKDKPSEKPLEDENVIYACLQDEDCISVSSGCCGCNAGGTAIAINENYRSNWNNKFLATCTRILCAQFMSNDWTCFAQPKCVEGKCQLIKN